MDATHARNDEPDLVIAGRIGGAVNCDVDVAVAIEKVVPDHEIGEIIAVYCARVETDADGRFADRYEVPHEIRQRMRGWVMCTVVVQPQIAGASPHSKVVRWHRSSSDELISGLSALLASVSFDITRVDAPYA